MKTENAGISGVMETDPQKARRARARKRGIAARDALGRKERERRSLGLVRNILSSPEFRKAEVVMLYRAVRGEASLAALEAALREMGGKTFAYPLCREDFQMEARCVLSEHAWRVGAYGIEEPDPARSRLIDPASIDLVLCPCTAFDEGCRRMGMGAGYYDRYLVKCENAVIAACALEVQKVGEVPVDPWDVPMDLIYTDQAIYRR